MSEKQKKNEININGKPVQVTPKRLTFFDVQAIAPLFANSDMNFSNYWRYAFYNWLEYNPSIEVELITPEEGRLLTALLPQPPQVMDWLVFREAKSDASNSSYMADLLTNDFATNEKAWNTF